MSASVRPVLAVFPSPRAPQFAHGALLASYRPALRPAGRALTVAALDAPLGTGAGTSARKSGRAQIVAAFLAASLCGWTVYADPLIRDRALAIASPIVDALIPPPPAVLIGDVSAKRGEVDGQTILYVEGSVRNATRRARRAPTLRIALIGEDGQPLYSWTAKPTNAELTGAGSSPFRARLLSPPPFRTIAVTLAD